MKAILLTVSSSLSSSSMREGTSSSARRCTFLVAGFFGLDGKVGQLGLRCPAFQQRKQSPFSWQWQHSSVDSFGILMASMSIPLGSFASEEDEGEKDW